MTGEPIAIVSGSGLDLRPLLDEVLEERPFRSFPGLGAAAVPGHDGAFVLGRHAGRTVILQCGRLHAYEGLATNDLGRTVQVLATLGARTAVFTNAAGGLLPEATPGSLVAADEVWCWPYRRAHLPPILKPSLTLTGCDARGVYVWMHGPCYETRAEVRVLADWGGATVGMSTAPELVQCEALGLRTAVVSCVTNNCLQPAKLTHDHVLKTARKASMRLCRVLAENLQSLADA